MNSLEAFFSFNPALAAILPPVIVAFVVSTLFAYAGMGYMVGFLQIHGVHAQRSAFDKCAKQLATLGLILGWCLLIGARIWIFFNTDSYVPRSNLGKIIELGWGCLGIAVVTSSLHFALWKPFKSHKIMHGSLALLSGINGTLAVVAILGSIRLFSALDLPNAAELNLYELFNFRLFPSPLDYACGLFFPLIAGMPAAFALVWLLVRRRRDDFGRDYYNNMIPWCARWAFVAWIFISGLYLLTVVADLWQMISTGSFDLGLDEGVTYALRFLPALVACRIWFLVSRSPMPLRHKPEIIAAFILCFVSGYFIFSDATSFIF